jgi:hypothetical protein
MLRLNKVYILIMTIYSIVFRGTFTSTRLPRPPLRPRSPLSHFLHLVNTIPSPLPANFGANLPTSFFSTAPCALRRLPPQPEPICE